MKDVQVEKEFEEEYMVPTEIVRQRKI